MYEGQIIVPFSIASCLDILKLYLMFTRRIFQFICIVTILVNKDSFFHIILEVKSNRLHINNEVALIQHVHRIGSAEVAGKPLQFIDQVFK